MTIRKTASITSAFALSLMLFGAPYVVVFAEPVPDPSSEPAAQADSGTEEGTAQVETGDAASDAEVVNEANTAGASVPGDSEEPADEPPLEEQAPAAGLEEEEEENAQPLIASTTPEVASTTPQNHGSTTVEVEQDAGLQTAATSSAATGENQAFGAGDASILTGNGSASAYLLSIFNVALTNSHGEILFLRNPLASELDLTARIKRLFEDLTGGAGECTFTSCEMAGGSFNFFGNQTARVENNLLVSCDTGNNHATSSEGAASVATGDCQSSGVIVNFGNLLIADSRYLVLLMDQTGDLDGNIVLPDGDFFETLSTGSTLGGGSSLAASSTALITNNATTSATSGGNTASTTGTGGATVHTGDASADGSILNIANRLGAPICFIISVGGGWNGQVHQLPAGFTHESTPFGEFVCGSGGAERPGPSNFRATTTNYAELLNTALVEASTGGNTATGDGALIETGDASSFLRILNLVNQTVVGQDWLFGLFTIAGDWQGDLIFGVLPGAPPQDQIAGGLVSNARKGSDGVRSHPGLAKLIFEKTGAASTTSPGIVEYTIRIRSDAEAGPSFNTSISDTIVGPGGTVLHTEVFELGEIVQGEEIVIEYAIELAENAPRGFYTNTATLEGLHHAPEGARSKPFSLTAVQTLELGSGEILGACAPYLTGVIRPGAQNDPAQVLLLKSFLQDTEGETLSGTGEYDTDTIEAVKRFQQKYADDILSPWGAAAPTGHVYHTTQLKINELVCGDADLFGLTDIQIQEIQRWRTASTGSVSQTPSQQSFSVSSVEVPEVPAPAVAQTVATPPQPEERSVVGRVWEWLTSRLVRIAEAAI